MTTRVRPIKDTSKTKRTTKYNRLKDYRWGVGIEHEMHVFHAPDSRLLKKNEHFKDFVVYDSWGAVLNILNNPNSSKYRLTPLQRKFIYDDIPFETSGRLCKGKWVLKKIDFKMPEIITDHPFSSLKEGKRSVESYCRHLFNQETEFIDILSGHDALNKSKIKNYGPITTYPFGMSSYISEPKSYSGGEYKYKSSLVKDYTGSYHLTLTLPYNEKTTDKAFIKMHQNFANQLQWLEPLLLTAFFSCDDTAVGTSYKKIRGSFRVMRVGWGNLAGSDIRKFNKGIGRYSNIKTYWREGLDFYDIDKLKWCSSVTIREPGAISALSSNFRTFGPTDPNNPEERISGAPMSIPNGLEFRIFDHFPVEYLQELAKFIILVAENSRKHQTKKYVYQNKHWKEAVQEIMKEGWRAKLPKKYIQELQKHLGLKIKTKSIRAYEVFKEINNELFQKNKHGDWTYLMLEPESLKSAPTLPKINQRSWEMGFLIKMNRNKNILQSWNIILRSIQQYKTFTLEEFDDMYFRAFSRKNWSSNLEDVIYFLEDKGYLSVEHNPIGEIISFKVIRENIQEWSNADVDAMIQFEWSRRIFKGMENKLSYPSVAENVKKSKGNVLGKPLATLKSRN